MTHTLDTLGQTFVLDRGYVDLNLKMFSDIYVHLGICDADSSHCTMTGKYNDCHQTLFPYTL